MNLPGKFLRSSRCQEPPSSPNYGKVFRNSRGWGWYSGAYCRKPNSFKRGRRVWTISFFVVPALPIFVVLSPGRCNNSLLPPTNLSILTLSCTHHLCCESNQEPNLSYVKAVLNVWFSEDLTPTNNIIKNVCHVPVYFLTA